MDVFSISLQRVLKLPPRRQTTWSQQFAPTTTFGNALGKLCSIAGVTACSSSLRKCFVASCMTQAIYSGTAARTQRRGHTSKLHQCTVAFVMAQNRNRSWRWHRDRRLRLLPPRRSVRHRLLEESAVEGGRAGGCIHRAVGGAALEEQPLANNKHVWLKACCSRHWRQDRTIVLSNALRVISIWLCAVCIVM